MAKIQKRTDHHDYHLQVRCNKTVKAYSSLLLKGLGYPKYGETWRSFAKTYGLIHPEDRPAIDKLNTLRHELWKIRGRRIPCEDESLSDKLNADLNAFATKGMASIDHALEVLQKGKTPIYFSDQCGWDTPILNVSLLRLAGIETPCLEPLNMLALDATDLDAISFEMIDDEAAKINQAVETYNTQREGEGLRPMRLEVPYNAFYTIRVDFDKKSVSSDSVRESIEWICDIPRTMSPEGFEAIEANMQTCLFLKDILKEAKEKFKKKDLAPASFLAEVIDKVDKAELYPYPLL